MAAGSDDNFLEPTLVEWGSYIATINNGGPPGFWSSNTVPVGVTAGAVYDLFGMAVCTYEVPKEVLVVTYSTVAPAVTGNDSGIDTQITPATLGTPSVATVIVIAGSSIPLTLIEGAVSLSPDGLFIRSDANGDGAVEALPDAVSLLASLFGANPTPLDCLVAGNFKGDQAVDVADPVALLSWGFGNGNPPPAPFPDCGIAASTLHVTCQPASSPGSRLANCFRSWARHLVWW